MTATLAFHPQLGAAQVADEPFPVRADLRLGIGQHVGVRPDRLTHLTAEVALRTRGPVVIGVSGGIIDTRTEDVALMSPTRRLEEETVEILGGADFQGYAPRFGAIIGYALRHRGAQFELTAEGGWAHGVRRARSLVREEAWHPWAVGALGVRSPSGFGVQLGIGRYRSRTEYYSFGGQLRRGFEEWRSLGEFLVSVPVN